MRSTQIEDALYTVNDSIFSPALLEEGSRLIVINSMVRSRETCTALTQFAFYVKEQELSSGVPGMEIESSCFENLSASSTGYLITAGVIGIQGSPGILINNCTFKGNSGVRSGALFLQSRCITRVDFQFYNSATRAPTPFVEVRKKKDMEKQYSLVDKILE